MYLVQNITLKMMLVNGKMVTDFSDAQDGFAYVYHADIDDYTFNLIGYGADGKDVRYRNNFLMRVARGRMW